MMSGVKPSSKCQRRPMNILSRHSQTVFSLTVIALSILFSATASATAVQRSQERRINFNDGWLFLNARADGAEKPDFDHSQWKEVRLPHDWAIEVRSIRRRIRIPARFPFRVPDAIGGASPYPTI